MVGIMYAGGVVFGTVAGGVTGAVAAGTTELIACLFSPPYKLDDPDVQMAYQQRSLGEKTADFAGCLFRIGGHICTLAGGAMAGGNYMMDDIRQYNAANGAQTAQVLADDITNAYYSVGVALAGLALILLGHKLSNCGNATMETYLKSPAVQRNSVERQEQAQAASAMRSQQRSTEQSEYRFNMESLFLENMSHF